LDFLKTFYSLPADPPLLRAKKVQESRAIAGRTARCRCKFRYVSNFTTASYVLFPCHSMAFLLDWHV